MPTDDTSTPSYRAERRVPEAPDPIAEQAESSLGATSRGAIEAEGGTSNLVDEQKAAAPGADSDWRDAEQT